jgi:phosphosulfolactate synthase
MRSAESGPVRPKRSEERKPAVDVGTCLNLPPRAEKEPDKNGLAIRSAGFTHVIDKGMGQRQIEDLIGTSARYIDIIKLGWGTGYVTQNLREKVKLYQDAKIPVCFGGTLLEVAILQNRFDAFCDMVADLGMKYVEISNGVIDMTMSEKARFIRSLRKRGFTVLSEVGSKDSEKIIPPFHWVELIKSDLKAGAWKVICEARESGTVGLYFGSGEVRAGLVDEIVRGVDGRADRLIFEAPQRSQQIYMVRKLGSDVNLGNISTEDVIGLETLRLGLRGDTMPNFHLVDDWNREREAALEVELPQTKPQRRLKNVVAAPTPPAWGRR